MHEIYFMKTLKNTIYFFVLISIFNSYSCTKVCPDGRIGDNCENYDPERVQEFLDNGVQPFDLLNGGISMELLYGKTFEGGLIFHIDPMDGTGLIAASVDQSTGAEWGCYDQDVNGAESMEVGDGFQNTSEILSDCDQLGIAARLCNDLELEGKSDWYLPSAKELVLIFENLADADGNNENLGLEDEGNIGKLLVKEYWSSSEDSSDSEIHAFGVWMGNGFVSDDNKDRNKHVRAIRSFE